MPRVLKHSSPPKLSSSLWAVPSALARHSHPTVPASDSCADQRGPLLRRQPLLSGSSAPWLSDFDVLPSPGDAAGDARHATLHGLAGEAEQGEAAHGRVTRQQHQPLPWLGSRPWPWGPVLEFLLQDVGVADCDSLSPGRVEQYEALAHIEHPCHIPHAAACEPRALHHVEDLLARREAEGLRPLGCGEASKGLLERPTRPSGRPADGRMDRLAVGKGAGGCAEGVRCLAAEHREHEALAVAFVGVVHSCHLVEWHEQERVARLAEGRRRRQGEERHAALRDADLAPGAGAAREQAPPATKLGVAPAPEQELKRMPINVLAHPLIELVGRPVSGG
mmetsp:Transcript_38099/g.90514  ORF Transcript_38099/g.90514 Transcript_38099/m.90514 type:complete len:335 (-) Transcript_38099:4828-5832(-)